MNNEQYCGTKPILESEPIDIPNAKKCRENHGLPREDMTFGVFRGRRGKGNKKVSREREKAILEDRNNAESI